MDNQFNGNNFYFNNDDFPYIFNPYEEPPHTLNEEEKKMAKSIFSRTHLGLLLYFAVSYASLYLILFLFKTFLPQSVLENEKIISVLNILLNAIPQYLFAFPALFLLIKNVKKNTTAERNKMDFKEFISLFLIGETFMSIGAFIGNLINLGVSKITGSMPDNNITEMIDKTPIWLLILVVVIIGPIFEELIFRKLLIDRLSVCGDGLAITFSAIAFGFFHGNLYQLFYATMLGFILGYVYTRTRDIKYSIIMHMIINFFGSVIPVIVTPYMQKIEKLKENFEAGLEINQGELLLSTAITSIYSLFVFAMFISGIIILAKYVSNKDFYINKKCEIPIPKNEKTKICFLNIGVILYYIFCTAIIILNLIP